MKKILISAGEASGDFYGARLARGLLKNKKIKVMGFGGEKMRAAGVDVKINLVKYAIIGFIEIFLKGPALLLVYMKASGIIRKEKPDALVVIDYPGFHMKLIKAARRAGIKKIIYYITPQVWVWKYERVRALKKYTDLVIVKMDFEEKIFRKEKIPVRYFGHPMAEEIMKLKKENADTGAQTGRKRKPVIGIFPGSRKKEINNFLPRILTACGIIKKSVPGAVFKVFAADAAGRQIIEKTAGAHPGIKIRNASRKEMPRLDCAIAKSGTTTLELALLSVPHVVVYSISAPEYAYFSRQVKIKFVGLPNIISGKAVVKELLQSDFNPDKTAAEIIRIINDARYTAGMKQEFAKIRKRLYKKGTAVKTAKAVMEEAGA